MATKKDAMTPEEAAAAIADVHEYRQGLTARAAGLIWMVWGFVFAAWSLTAAAAWDGPYQDEHSTTTFWYSFVFFVAVLLGGIIATAAIRKAQAIVQGTTFRSWLVAVAVLAVLGVAALGAVELLYILVDALIPNAPTPHYKDGLPVGAAFAALALTWFQRKHAALWPGIVAVVAMLVLQASVPFLLGESDELYILARLSFIEGAAVLAVFTAVGLWHFRRG